MEGKPVNVPFHALAACFYKISLRQETNLAFKINENTPQIWKPVESGCFPSHLSFEVDLIEVSELRDVAGE